MDINQLQQLDECIVLTQRLAAEFQQNKDDISLCVGPRVVKAYQTAMNGAIEQISSVQKNLMLLHQIIGCV